MISFDAVSKTYRSLLGQTVHAVQDFTLDIAEGEVLGIAGPNGAGKSTLINLLLGYQFPTSGRVTIFGQAPRNYVESAGIGYVSELVAINPRWRVTGALRRFAILAGVPQDRIDARINAVIAELGLEEHKSKQVKTLSKGNVQRLGIAQSLLHEVKVLVFDEPTHGLDPVWMQNFRDIVQRMRKPDRCIVIASHNLDELQRLADRVAIIDHGRLQRLVSTGYDETPGEVLAYRLDVVQGGTLVPDVFAGAQVVDSDAYEVVVHDLAELNRGLADLMTRGALIASVAPARTRLEEQFRVAVGGAQQA